MMSIWWALFFMFLGGTIVELGECKAWTRYKQGKREGREHHDPADQRKGGY